MSLFSEIIKQIEIKEELIFRNKGSDPLASQYYHGYIDGMRTVLELIQGPSKRHTPVEEKIIKDKEWKI